jgi:hypothetical protein
MSKRRSKAMDEDEYIYELRKALGDAKHVVCSKYCPDTWDSNKPQPHHHFCKSITKVLAGKHYDGKYKPTEGPTPEQKLMKAIFGDKEQDQ